MDGGGAAPSACPACPNCGAQAVIQDIGSNLTLCEACGFVLEEADLVSGNDATNVFDEPQNLGVRVVFGATGGAFARGRTHAHVVGDV